MSMPVNSSADASVEEADWQRRVVGRSLSDATQKSIDRGARLIRAAATVLERNNGESLTVQEVADEAGQSLRTLYQYFASKDDLLLAVFEESQVTYARMLRGAIDGLTDPVERLAGAVIASARLLERHRRSGFDRGMTQLRAQLSQAAPELVARSQEPVTAVFRELVSAAGAPDLDVEAATFLVMNARLSYLKAVNLGSDLSAGVPDVLDLSSFCLGGLGLTQPRHWHEAVDAKLLVN